MLGLARGLEYSHDQGVTHRDLKATNILISNTGVAKLVDFGLATIEGDDSRHGITSQRTVDYSALERTCGSPKGDPRSDIYFLGCVFYHMLTGQVALEDSESKDPLKKMLKRSFGVIKPISEHRYAPAEPLAQIVEKMMKMDLKARYQHMHEVVAALEEYQASVDPDRGRDSATFARKLEQMDTRKCEESLKQRSSTRTSSPDEVERDLRSGAARGQGRRREHGALRGGPGRDPGRPAEEPEPDGLSRPPGERCRAAAERYREAPSDAVIFDTDGLGDEAVEALADMHEKAEEDGHPLVALVLLGPRQGALREKLPPIDRLKVLSKPIKLKEVQDAITELLPVH